MDVMPDRLSQERDLRVAPSIIARSAVSSTIGDSDVELARGMQTFAIVAGVITFASFIIVYLAELLAVEPAWSQVDYVREFGEAIAQGLLAIGAYRVARSPRYGAHAKLLVGGALYAMVAFISTCYDVYYLEYNNFALNPSWVATLVLLYALLVPAKTRHHAMMAGAASAALPAGLLLYYGAGQYTEPFGSLAGKGVAASVPTWLCALVSIFVVRRAERHRARLARMKANLKMLGSYALIAKIGEGGMGEVWVGCHEFLARPAAIKVIRPSLRQRSMASSGNSGAHEVTLARFAREARVTSRLTSPHTVRLFDYGQADEESFYYVMELLDGMDVESIVRRYGPMPEERVRHLLIQACDALHEAHESDLIHRDVKPANVLVCKKGGIVDFVKVLDFGLVIDAVTAVSPSHDARLTQQGVVQGTPTYMSPEQALGREALDRRTDVYALACVGYFMLTGSDLFRGETTMEVLMKHIQDAPTPPSKRYPDNPISAPFEAILMRCLEKERARRPATAAELGDLLQELSLPRPWRQTEARAWAEAHPIYGRHAHHFTHGARGCDDPAADPTVETPRGLPDTGGGAVTNTPNALPHTTARLLPRRFH